MDGRMSLLNSAANQFDTLRGLPERLSANSPGRFPIPCATRLLVSNCMVFVVASGVFWSVRWSFDRKLVTLRKKSEKCFSSCVQSSLNSTFMATFDQAAVEKCPRGIRRWTDLIVWWVQLVDFIGQIKSDNVAVPRQLLWSCVTIVQKSVPPAWGIDFSAPAKFRTKDCLKVVSWVGVSRGCLFSVEISAPQQRTGLFAFVYQNI